MQLYAHHDTSRKQTTRTFASSFVVTRLLRRFLKEGRASDSTRSEQDRPTDLFCCFKCCCPAFRRRSACRISPSGESLILPAACCCPALCQAEESQWFESELRYIYMQAPAPGVCTMPASAVEELQDRVARASKCTSCEAYVACNDRGFDVRPTCQRASAPRLRCSRAAQHSEFGLRSFGSWVVDLSAFRVRLQISP